MIMPGLFPEADTEAGEIDAVNGAHALNIQAAVGRHQIEA